MKFNFFQKLIRSSAFTCSIVMGLLPLQAQAELPDFTKLIEQNDQVVVNISTSRTIKPAQHAMGPMGGGPMGEMPFEGMQQGPFQDLFRHFFDEMMPPQGEYNTKSLGSGFIVSADGYIVTNNHVIHDADEIQVRLLDGRYFIGKVIGSDPHSDLAVIKIDAKDLPVAKFGSSEDLKIGEWVVAIGSPFGFDHSATAGIVSAKSRNLRSEQYVPFIQTDAAVNPGNSGGPLFNMKGEVVGINSQIVSNGGGGYLGLSFAVPSDVAKSVIEQLKGKGYVIRGWLGVSLQPVDAALAQSFGLAKNEGALIADVVEEGPAAQANIKPGDVIVAINGKKISNAGDVPPIVGNVIPNTVVDVNIIREKKPMTLKVKITELPREEEAKAAEPGKNIKNSLGVQVRNLQKEERARLQLEHGGIVIDRVEPQSPAAKAGIRPGDILFRVGQIPVEDAITFNNLMKKMDKNTKMVPVLIARHGEGRRYMVIKLD